MPIIGRLAGVLLGSRAKVNRGAARGQSAKNRVLDPQRSRQFEAGRHHSA